MIFTGKGMDFQVELEVIESLWNSDQDEFLINLADKSILRLFAILSPDSSVMIEYEVESY
jgi:hypothetical protein